MKTPDEIKTALVCCSQTKCGMSECAYYSLGGGNKCIPAMCADALALIQQLEAENVGQAETIMWMEAERDDLKRTIQQLEAQAPRWIPVEERLPLPHEDVAIIIRQGGYTYLRVGWYGCACQWMQAGLGMIEGEVTHWLPLPESPKEE